jgi:hypothetical protein
MENAQDTTQQTEEKVTQSPFIEIKEMNLVKATNILLSAANAAQGAGALSVRDSVLVASAGEFLTDFVNSQK